MQLNLFYKHKIAPKLVLVFLLGSVFHYSQAQPREFIEGVHYQALANPVPTQTDADRIEVREIFWYGCPECATLEPVMTDWGEGVRGDLVLHRTPAIWNDIMALHARIYYSAIAVNALDAIHREAFKAIHQNNNPLRTEPQIRQLFLANNVTAEAFEKAWNSGEVNSQVENARLRTAEYGVDKLPSVIVNGRFEVNHNKAIFNHIELNIAVNMLVRRLRDERRTDF